MDFDDHNNNNNAMWEWRGEDYSLQRYSQADISHFLWDEVKHNEDFSHMLDGQTPIKDCGDFDHQVSNSGDNTNKAMEESRESSQLKRRRMLHFNSDSNEAGVRDGSMMEDGLSESLQWNSQWISGFSDDRCDLTCEELDQSSEGWLMDCLNESDIQCSIDEMNQYVTMNEQADISEVYNFEPVMETDAVQEIPAPDPAPAPLRAIAPICPKVYKGRKSFIRAPTKLNTSIAYPFALIKPCGVHGDVTLNDINQRIHAPPPSRLKSKKDEDPSITYPASAFSGKPVVVKTKIRTEGGKGSITIMRTKG